MKKSILFFTMVLGTIFPCCKSAKYTPVDYPDKQIIFGKGGGMSGGVTEHAIFENGTVFKGTGMMEKTYEKQGRIDSETLQNLLNNLETLKLSEIQFDHPGNRYSYIEIKDNGLSHRITWGAQDQTVPKNAKLFFDLLNHHVSKL